ncbi:MAG: NAD-dependent succinate-semialdehyde dehydrogenase [Chloroflexota bacterium]|nr:NAD-dependent succinate-semialdehyde dehydrogenase [Chloroflexota bacterium]
MATRTASIVSINPATEEVLASYEAFDEGQVDRALDEAQDAFVAWRVRSFPERAVPMKRLAALLRERVDRYARLLTLEMGKPITEAKAEIEKCAFNCDFYAEHAAEFLRDQPAPANGTRSYVAFQPLGIVLAVMPWNYPFWQVIRFAAPALMAGNAAVLKHASNVPQAALALEELMRDAGFPEGLFRTLLLAGAQVEPVIADPRIRAVTLTGSSDTGRRIASLAGQALKKCVLELGGSDPFIVLADADIETAATIGTRARNQNNGQSCIAAKRFLIEEAVLADFELRFAAKVSALKIGDPVDPATQIGPLARPDLRDTLERQVAASVKMGARVLAGGERWGTRGNFYAPTVLAGVTRHMPVFNEETFGPVAAVMKVRDADEAIVRANDSPYGLGGNLWTNDLRRAESLARRIDTGQVFINGMTASDPRLPFGGTKQSGYGRELSEYGIKEFVNIQTIWIGPARAATPAPQSE